MRRWKSSLFANNGISMGALIVIFSLISLMFISGCDDDDTVTNPNDPPPVPVNPYPADGAVAQDIEVRLQWYCVDPDNDALTYYIYLSTTNPPDLVDTVNTYLYNHDRLEFNTTYYWKVEADDGNGHTTESEVWSFTTGQLFFIDDYDANRARRLYLSDNSLIHIADDNWGMRIFQMTDTSRIGARIDSVGAVSLGTVIISDVITSGDTSFVASGKGLILVDEFDPTVPGYFEHPDPDSDNVISLFEYDSDTVNHAYESEAVGLAGGYAIIAGPEVEWDDGLSDRGDTTSIITSIDYTVPYHMALADSIKLSKSIFTDLYIAGNYAYVADSLNGLRVFDISDPTNMSLVSTTATQGDAMAIGIHESVAYIADGISGLSLYSVANPASPTFISNIEVPGRATDICVYEDPVSSKTHAYIAANWDGGLQIVDVTDPNDMEIVASRETAGGCSGVFAKRSMLDTDDDGTADDVILVYLTDTYLGLYVFEFQP